MTKQETLQKISEIIGFEVKGFICAAKSQYGEYHQRYLSLYTPDEYDERKEENLFYYTEEQLDEIEEKMIAAGFTFHRGSYSTKYRSLVAINSWWKTQENGRDKRFMELQSQDEVWVWTDKIFKRKSENGFTIVREE